MKEVAVIMGSGFSDRLNALEHALENHSIDELDIYWMNQDGFYADVNFHDFFRVKNCTLDIKLVKAPTVWDLSKYIPSYRTIFSHHGMRIIDKYNKKENILIRNYLELNTSMPSFIDSSFIGIHCRAYDPLRNSEEYKNNLFASFEEIYDENKKYFFVTDSEDFEKLVSGRKNVITHKKLYSNKVIRRFKESLNDTIYELQNLGNCGVIYRSIGGFAYSAAVLSGKSPEVKQLTLDDKFTNLNGARR